MDQTARHLRLLTETIAAVNSTLDLGEVFDLIARKVAEALETDACFVYLYDEASDELAERSTPTTMLVSSEPPSTWSSLTTRRR